MHLYFAVKNLTNANKSTTRIITHWNKNYPSHVRINFDKLTLWMENNMQNLYTLRHHIYSRNESHGAYMVFVRYVFLVYINKKQPVHIAVVWHCTSSFGLSEADSLPLKLSCFSTSPAPGAELSSSALLRWFTRPAPNESPNTLIIVRNRSLANKINY